MTLILGASVLFVAVSFGLFLWRDGRKAVKPALIFQFGRFINTRPGIKNNDNWRDEPEVVEFVDFRYWVRLRPNPRFNLPVLGYWSKLKGRKGP